MRPGYARCAVFTRYATSDPLFDGHWELTPDLNWEQLPTFNWCDLYTQVGYGLDDPEWCGWSKKSRNKAKREKIREAEREMRDYEARCHRRATKLG